MTYNKDSIVEYTPLEGIRKKLGMYVGSTDNEAVHHVIKELVGNSIDEANAGFGKTIKVCLDPARNSVVVRDYGRGIPPEKLDDIFTKTHVSGKFQEESRGYESSIGTNGVGCAIATATGQVRASVFQNGWEYTNNYDYERMGVAKKHKSSRKRGTEIEWSPDEGVVTGTKELYPGKIKQMLEDFSYATPGISYEYSEKHGNPQTFLVQDTAEYLENKIDKEDLVSPIMRFSAKNNNTELVGALVWGSKKVEKSFFNLSPTFEQGTHVTVLKTVVTREFNKTMGTSLSGNEIRENMSFVLAVKTKHEPIFTSQSKVKVNMPSITAELSQLLTPIIAEVILINKKFFESLVKLIEKQKKRQQADVQIRSLLSQARTRANPVPNKLKPALNTQGAELFIVEGDSAAGSLIRERNVTTHAIMALRGKIINFKKHDIEKVLKNQEIQDLIITLGGWGESYNGSNAPYDRYIIAVDPDEDGSHIRLLLVSFFFEFYPKLIEQGKLYFLESPLYMIETNKGRDYAFTEEEMEEKRKKLPANAIVSRFKGLGQLDSKVLADFAFSSNRRVKQYQIKDSKSVAEQLEIYLGQSSEERRELVG